LKIELRGREYDFDWQDFPPSVRQLAETHCRKTRPQRCGKLQQRADTHWRRFGYALAHNRARAEKLIFAALDIGDALCWARKPNTFGHVYQRHRKPTFADALKAAKAGGKRLVLNLCRCFDDLLSVTWAAETMKRLGRKDRKLARDGLRKARMPLKRTQGERLFLMLDVPRF
jgi:hypothetical protein